MSEWEFEIEEAELYYKYCRAQDRLVPLDKMIYRESRSAEIHFNKVNELEDGPERTWRMELYFRFIKRSTKWQNHSEDK